MKMFSLDNLKESIQLAELSPVQKKILLDFASNKLLFEEAEKVEDIKQLLEEEMEKYRDIRSQIDLGIYGGLKIAKELITLKGGI